MLKQPCVPISIVVPVYNGMTTVDLCLPALLAQQDAILGKDFEIIVVDDGSTDGSGKYIAQHFPQVHLITHAKNRGRIEARLNGVQAARFDRILLIDIRVIADLNLLKSYWAIGTPSRCMAVEVDDQAKHQPLKRVFHCLRAAYYQPDNISESEQRLTITCENFLRARKGTTAIFLDRQTYMDSLPERRDKTVNDDTRLFARMLEEGPLFRDYRLKIIYLHRLTFAEELPHLYERGVRFADYYLTPRGAYRWHAGAIFIASLLSTGMFVWQPAFTGSGLLFLFAGICIWLARRPMDFILLILYLPILLAAFATGAMVGILSIRGDERKS